MRDAGRIVRAVLDELGGRRRGRASPPGELDRLAESRTRELGAVPAFKGYLGYPASVCISVNDEVVHGIPSARRVLRDGDLVGLDFGAIVGGFHGDAAETVAGGAGEPGGPPAGRRRPGRRSPRGSPPPVAGGRLGDIGAAVQRSAEACRLLGGPGLRRARHRPEAPRAARRSPTSASPGTGAWLRPGLVLAIEPMVNAGLPGRPDARGRLDGGDRGREPFRALRAHRGRHRGGSGGTHPVGDVRPGYRFWCMRCLQPGKSHVIGRPSHRADVRGPGCARSPVGSRGKGSRPRTVPPAGTAGLFVS